MTASAVPPERLPPARPVTLVDIAREAGTSPATASRALSGRGYVSAAVRARTVAAAKRLGYVPNASARTLKQKTSRVVGVAVSDLSNEFYARLAAGIEQTLRDSDYQMILLSDNSERGEEVDGARTFLAMRAPGVILTPVANDAIELLTRHGVAVVEVDRRLATGPCDAVVIDNERGALAATAHLLSLGHVRVALLVADTDWTTDAGRRQGYLAAHDAAGVEVDERLILTIAYHARDAEERIAALLDVEEPTAIFAANNLLTEQAWRVLRRRGLRLPRDFSLVGFDDVPWMEMVEPGITAVAQPTTELGRRAARQLLRRMANPALEPAVEVLQPTLVVRGSTGPAPAVGTA
ncbi:MAG: LacI family DNA-binding transcriptional regulator [Gaiellaceae bacterium]